MPTVSFAKAGTQEFSDPIAFADAVKNRFSIGFNGIRPVGSPYQSFGSLSVCGVNFSTPTAGAFVNVTAADYYDPNTYPTDFIVDAVNASTNNQLDISLPERTYAVGFEYGGLGFNGVGVGTITLSNGHVFTTVLPTVGHTQFVGFVAEEPIASVTFVAINDSWVIRRVDVGGGGPEAVDHRDDSEEKVHFLYVLPCDGVDQQLDKSGTIEQSVEAFQRWLAGETGGQRLRVDQYRSGLDVTFLRIGRTEGDLASYGIFLRDQLEAEIHAAGFNDAQKIYGVYYGGRSTAACGGAPWPPTLVGNVAALYLFGQPPGAIPCANNQFAGPNDPPGYWEFAMIHEIVHALGFVATCAPHHTLAGHVSDDSRDLMYAGNLPWQPSILDVGGDDYFGHNNVGCPDLRESPFLTRKARRSR